MNHLKISLAEVSETSAAIKSCNLRMYEALNAIKKEMNATGSSWISEGGETIRSRFNQFAARFDTQKDVIESYARFLDRTVETYDTLETTITSNAGSMQS